MACNTVAAAFNIMLKVSFNNFIESSTNRMPHVAVLPQWNTAFSKAFERVVHSPLLRKLLNTVPLYTVNILSTLVNNSEVVCILFKKIR